MLIHSALLATAPGMAGFHTRVPCRVCADQSGPGRLQTGAGWRDLEGAWWEKPQRSQEEASLLGTSGGNHCWRLADRYLQPLEFRGLHSLQGRLERTPFTGACPYAGTGTQARWNSTLHQAEDPLWTRTPSGELG